MNRLEAPATSTPIGAPQRAAGSKPREGRSKKGDKQTTKQTKPRAPKTAVGERNKKKELPKERVSLFTTDELNGMHAGAESVSMLFELDFDSYGSPTLSCDELF